MAIVAIGGVLLIILVLWEGFETIVLPRRVTRRFRLTRVFYHFSWIAWTRSVYRLVPTRQRETWLSWFGPLSLLLLLSIWAMGLITGFALLQYAVGSASMVQSGSSGLFTDLYMSGTTFFTVGLGDAVPRTAAGRLLVMAEGGIGFGFLAMVISYLPALNQSFSRREVSISLLDARAGSPPTAAEMLARHGHERGMETLRQLLFEWERWSAEFLEGHLSYPVLAYFRSQHENQSWLAALTAILDTCALIMAGVEGACERQAELTFAMARHAVVDLSLVFNVVPREMVHDRLPPEALAELRERLAGARVKLYGPGEADLKLTELRWLYEPYLEGLANHFLVRVPPWISDVQRADNWQTSTWNLKPSGLGEKREHF